MSEHDEQVILCQCLDLMKVKYFAIPNGGARNAVTGKMLKDEGVKKGVPDLFIPVQTKYSGLFIEMKFGKNKLSQEQVEWIQYLRSQNFDCIICYSAKEAIEKVRNYLTLNK